MADPINDDLVGRLDKARVDHLRLASWNRGKDRPARVAFHHDTALAIRDTIAILKARPSAGTGSHKGEGEGA